MLTYRDAPVTCCPAINPTSNVARLNRPVVWGYWKLDCAFYPTGLFSKLNSTHHAPFATLYILSPSLSLSHSLKHYLLPNTSVVKFSTSIQLSHIVPSNGATVVKILKGTVAYCSSSLRNHHEELRTMCNVQFHS